MMKYKLRNIIKQTQTRFSEIFILYFYIFLYIGCSILNDYISSKNFFFNFIKKFFRQKLYDLEGDK